MAHLIQNVPKNWIAVHLCPNPLTDDKTKKSLGGRTDPALFKPHLNDVLNLDGIANDTLFKSWPMRQWRERKYNVSVGGPVAFILRKSRAAELRLRVAGKDGHDDIILSEGEVADDSYVVKNPHLCYHSIGISTIDAKWKSDVKVPYPYNP